MNEFEELIEKAKLRVMRAYDPYDPPTPRKWLTANLDSYGDSAFRVSIMVLEGSPAKGYVIADYGRATVQAVDAWGKRLHRWRTKSGKT